MSAGPASDLARLERLRDQFHDAGCDFPRLDAGVVSEPDLRRNDTASQARELRSRRRSGTQTAPEPTVRGSSAGVLAMHPECTLDELQTAQGMEEWVPPHDASPGRRGLATYRDYHVLGHGEDGPGPPAGRTRWRCLLFGLPAGEAGQTAASLFENLASEAARLILGGKGQGKCPTSDWLIHLADRDEPLQPRSGKQYLNLLSSGVPSWYTVNPRKPWCWWAVRLHNVLQHSRDAIQLVIDATGQTPARIRCDESDRSVYLDGKRVVSEMEPAVFRFFKVIAEVHPNPISFARIMDRASGLHGKNRTRDLKDRLPAPLDGWVKSGKHGYGLKLPAKKM